MIDGSHVELPGGVWIDGVRATSGRLRALTGVDEEYLGRLDASGRCAEVATRLLAGCLLELGPVQEPDREFVRALTVGDREALLLQLRALTFGERIPGVATCPRPSCGERLDLDLRVDQLLLPAYADAAPVHERIIDGAAVRFRLPNGADQEAVASLALVDAGRAGAALVRRCVLSVDGDAHPSRVEEELGTAMAALDPQAELVLDLVCPVCGKEFRSAFDTTAFLLHELASRVDTLYRDVHTLASQYHWSERDILALSTGKRQCYLGLVGQTAGPRGGKWR